MKKTNRIRLLIASTAVLGASILIPTLLTACSTASDNNNNNNNNGQQQVIDQALMDKIIEVNKENNKNTRKSIYQEYMFELNKANSRTNKALDLPQAPKKDYLGVVTKRLKDIVTTDKFVEEFVQMIETELDTTGGPNTISQSELTKLVDMLKERDSATGQYKMAQIARGEAVGSTWGKDAHPAFLFDDEYKLDENDKSPDQPTWTYKLLKLNTIYVFKLYLTNDASFKYETQGNKVSVQITNLNSDLSKKIKLNVYTKKIDAQSNDPVISKDLYFKQGPINLPSSLFEEFDNYFKTRNTYFNNYVEYLTKGSKTYYDISEKGINTSATIWNQFMLQNYENLSKIINDDLIANKDNSQLIKWLEANSSSAEGTTGTSVLADLKSDLKNLSSTANPGIKDNIAQLTPIFIQGKNVNQKVLANNRLAINLPGNKLYAIDLYPTEFKFVPEVNKFFGYTDSYGFATNPTLTFSSNSEISSYIKTAGDGSQTSATKEKTNKITSNKPIDVNSLFNVNNVFSKYLSSSLDSGNQGTTNKLLDQQLNNPSSLFGKFENYYRPTNSKGHELLKKPEIISQLIFDNIDLSNMAYKTGNVNNNPEFDIKHESLWRSKVKEWITNGLASNKPNNIKMLVTVNDKIVDNPNFQNKSSVIVSVTDMNSCLDLSTIDSTSNNKKISKIGIFFGTQDGVNDVLVNSVTTATNGTQSSLFINPKSVKVTNPTEATDETDLLNKLGNNAWVVFQATTDNSVNGGPLYAFYMGANKDGTMSPIVIPTEFISTPEFAKAFTGK